MVRWFDGFFGGLGAGAASAAFYALAAAAWLRDDSPALAFATIGRVVPGLHDAPADWPAAGLGAVLYVLACGVLGIVYAAVARRAPVAWRAPGSVVVGLTFGILIWWTGSDVLVPLTGARDTRPVWEAVAAALLYGVVLSELTTMAHRRAASFARA